MPIGLAYGPQSHLTDLGAAADDNDSLPVNSYKRLRLLDRIHQWKGFELCN
jgi:hypothetical protein